MSISGTSGFGCFMPRNTSRDVVVPLAQPVDRVQQRQRVEPAVDAAGPDDHLVRRRDAPSAPLTGEAVCCGGLPGRPNGATASSERTVGSLS